MHEGSGSWGFARPLRLIVCIAILSSANVAYARMPMVEPPGQPINDDLLDGFLRQGGWSQTADDDPSARQLEASYIKGIVDAYVAKPSDPKAINDLGLVGLALAVAEWGVEPADGLPDDPAGKNWGGVIGADGKRLMSYSKGAIGVSHADSDSLADFFSFIKKDRGDSLPQATRFYQLQGINFDRLYADGGHCNRPSTVIVIDLNGKPFGYVEHGYAGDRYCGIYRKYKTNEEDWRIFRHNMRLVLRTREGQAYLINAWLKEYWWPSYRKVAGQPNGKIEDVIINSRIRNSSPVTANCTLGKARSSGDAISAQLNAYASKDCHGKPDHKRRWPYMMRAVVVYRFYANHQLAEQTRQK
ncbi:MULTISPECIES: hypothetical protein [Cupriavidus]|nr:MULTISPECIES: hypothetical protein [Cupriavidus]MCO4865596.1 hypothetical protein [Cupriavidus sp. WGlv3]MCO4893316.1 hypothetical protein [Cupriavidus sp. WGtm5]SOY75440.1 hypothetical protein CBM2592_P30016 [Cupriavidus taiwanensis]SOY75755.1 hypothetical protein CBM2585_P30017 [Cupriavidus taiwanensis]SOY76295.1 hypothetical protein CBM2589_P30015 [Cupriavidus taiwanensis]